MVSALTTSVVTIEEVNELPADIQTTISALRQLGVSIERSDNKLIVHGVGKQGFIPPTSPIDCGNSGTTARLLMGILASQQFSSELIGDASLSRRPMKRLAELLCKNLGADITTTNGSLPVTIRGKQLHTGEVILPVASAQIKSSLLLAAYVSGVDCTIEEPWQSRDHTELLFQALGVSVERSANRISARTSSEMLLASEYSYTIPNDLSAAVFLIVGALIAKKNIRLEHCVLNPTRTAALDCLIASGAPIFFESVYCKHGERIGIIIVAGEQATALRPFTIGGELIANLQDEIPALSVLAMFLDGNSVIEDAGELRLKESDRLAAIAKNIRLCGGTVEETPHELSITGNSIFAPIDVTIDTAGDHRIAMSFALLQLRADVQVTIPEASVVTISYPSFFTAMDRLAT